jgi:hypothetical protein
MKFTLSPATVFCLTLALSVFQTVPLHAQDQTSSKPPQTKAPADATAQDEGEADEPVAPNPADLKKDPAKAKAAAWQLLDTGVSSPKPQPRIDALNALGSLGGDRHAEDLLVAAMKDKDVDVRLSSVAAMAAMENRNVIPQLRIALDDSSPEVAFAAAVSLWKMHDQSGINLLYGVLTGERKAHSGFVTTELHEANKDMHSPSTLAEIGAEQGAYALLGPFGIGLDVAKMMRKSSNGNSARVLTANLLSEDRSAATEKTFLDALQDKDYFVRLASARALGKYHGQAASDALIGAFADAKPSVRDMAAASYLRSTTLSEKRTKRSAHSAAPAKAG